MAYPVPIKGFLQLSPEAGAPTSSFLMVQSVSPKDIAGSDLAS